MIVFDASALLAYVGREEGHDVVKAHLGSGGVCSAANWSEVAQKVLASGVDWQLVRQLLLSYDLSIAAVTTVDAEAAALLWRRGSGLSLADRLCLALASRLELPALTGDSAWGAEPNVMLIR